MTKNTTLKSRKKIVWIYKTKYYSGQKICEYKKVRKDKNK